MPALEAACFCLESVQLATDAGVDRIELCADRKAGGTTPPLEVTISAVAIARQKDIPVFIMIRPRGGDFVYTDPEFQRMLVDVRTAKEQHVAGFVFGVLTSDRTVDVRRTGLLVRTAYPLPCTFHRAFDETSNVMDALEDVCKAGCAAVLTSGGKSTAVEGSSEIAELVSEAASRLTIIAGGGVRSDTLQELLRATNAAIYHSSAVTQEGGVADAGQLKSMIQTLSADGDSA
jgi:copper homeostasis protein